MAIDLENLYLKLQSDKQLRLLTTQRSSSGSLVGKKRTKRDSDNEDEVKDLTADKNADGKKGGKKENKSNDDEDDDEDGFFAAPSSGPGINKK